MPRAAAIIDYGLTAPELAEFRREAEVRERAALDQFEPPEIRELIEGKGWRTNRLARRAMAIRYAALGWRNDAIAKKLSVTPQFVNRWRRRMADAQAAMPVVSRNNPDIGESETSHEFPGVDCLRDRPGKGRPPAHNRERLLRMIERLCQRKKPPHAKRRWSVRDIADELDLSSSTVQRILHPAPQNESDDFERPAPESKPCSDIAGQSPIVGSARPAVDPGAVAGGSVVSNAPPASGRSSGMGGGAFSHRSGGRFTPRWRRRSGGPHSP